MILWSASSNGPRLIPGAYRVRLTANGSTREQEFRIHPDPRVPQVTDADLQAQLALALQVRDATSAANQAVVQIRELKAAIAERAAQDASVQAAGAELATKLSAVEETLYQVRLQSSQDPLNYPIRLNNKLAALLNQVESVPGRPTQQAYQVFEQLRGQLDVQLEALQKLLAEAGARLNQLLEARNLAPLPVQSSRPTA
jgi:hypothetical protein